MRTIPVKKHLTISDFTDSNLKDIKISLGFKTEADAIEAAIREFYNKHKQDFKDR